MSIHIQIRDYRGIARADIDLAPIALVAGLNEQGKSSLAQAVRAVLTGTAIPIPGVAKKDAKLLVRDGAETGRVHLKDSDGFDGGIEWPKCTVFGERKASDFAAGLRHLFDMDEKERANVLAGYINSKPTVEDLNAAMEDAQYTQKSIDQVWASVNGPDGWDGTHKKAKEHGTAMKAKWEATTGEKYGATKAVDWRPNGYPNMVNTLDPRGGLEKELNAAKVELERLIGLAAVAKADIEGLRAKAASIPRLEKKEQDSKAQKDLLSKAYDALTRKPYPAMPQMPMQCPKCDAQLSLASGGKSLQAAVAVTASDIAAAKQATEEHKQALEEAKRVFEAAYDVHNNACIELRAANAARTELDNLKTGGGEIATETQVTEGRAKVDACQRALNAYDAATTAAHLHTQIVKNAALVDILAQDGLRKRKLAAGLSTFNDHLKAACEVAKWPAVRLDENLSPHYGTRPVWAASASGQWRARMVVQFVMATMDGSAVVVIDEADILDQRGRNSLFGMLKEFSTKAVVCMTANKPELVPDLAKAKMGQSYWVQDGVVHGLADIAKAKAA
jgi:hypothetical protein